MGKYHSKIIGQGQPCIFLPAFGFSGIEGLNVAEFISDEYECHLLDLPGIGGSEGINGRITINKIAHWLKDYIDENKLVKVTLIGHSMGAAIGMCFASLYPNYVSKIILLDQGHKKFPRFPTREFGPFAYAIPIISLLEKLFGDNFVKRIEKLFIADESHDKDTSTEKEEKRLKEFCNKFDIEESDYIRKAVSADVNFTREGIRLMFGYYRLNLPKLLNRISVPCLLVYASFKDKDLKESQITAKAINKLKPNKYLELFEMNSHHYVHWADGECLVKIKDFLLI